jgi:CO/xanthine dehydrogenase FAD-binding subunit
VRAALSTLDVVRPDSLDEALKAMRAASPESRPVPIAGGTDLFVYLNAGTATATRYLDLLGLAELRGIRPGADGVTIGATTTFREIREHPLLARRFPSLVQAAAEVGAWQIQNRATLAGNIANGSPAGDSLPVLLAHDAVVHARSSRGRRAIPFETLYRGYRDLALEPDELIVAVFLPFPPPRAFAFFRKVGTRRAQSISKVVFCGVLARDEKRRVSHVRLAFGSVAPVTLRARHAEKALADPRGTATAARTALARDIAPIDDIRSSREYRLAVAANVLAQFLRAAGPA